MEACMHSLLRKDKAGQSYDRFRTAFTRLTEAEQHLVDGEGDRPGK